MAITRIGNIASTIPDDSIQNVKFSNIVNFKNIIINGDMSIAQRGTSASNVSTGYDTVDRFKIIRGAGTLNVSQETDAPSGQGFAKSFKVLDASGSSPGASDSNRIQQIFEGQNLQYLKKGTSSAESLTLSFWIKAKVTGTYIVELFDADNARCISKTYTVSSSETWEKKTITYDGDTSGTLGNDNGGSLECTFWFTAGSNYTSGTLQTSWGSQVNANRAVGLTNALASANDYVQITGVQLEAGTTASDFEFLPHDVNKRRCLRYYTQVTQNHYFAGARANGTSGIIGGRFYTSVPLRAGPTIDAGTYQYYYGDAGGAGVSSSTTALEYQSDDTGLTFRLNSALSGLVDNEPVIVGTNSTIGFDSEL